MKQVDVISAASKAEQDKYATMAAKLRYEIDSQLVLGFEILT